MIGARLAELLDRYFERELTLEEKRELEAMLIEDAEARERFWETTEWHALFRQWGEEEGGRQTAIRERRARPGPRPRVVAFPEQTVRRGFPFRQVLAWAAVAAIAALASWKSYLPRQAGPPAVIAGLTRAADAVWADAASAPQPGRALKTGWLRLKAGAVQVEFSRGARVVVQGPAEFQLVSENEGRLAFGKLWARVPPTAHGFTVRTRGFTAVDLGTEFGCNVPATGPTELHVFTGAVELQTPSADPWQVHESRAVRLDGGVARELPAQRGAFLGEEQMPQRAAFLRASRTSEDIGNPRGRGSSSVDPKSGTWSVGGGGADIYGTSDQFHFVSQEFATDGTIIAKVTAVQRTDGYSKAGVMFRASAKADAAFAHAYVGTGTIGFEYRKSSGQTVVGAAYVGGFAPMWVKLERRGSSFTGSYSADGIAWSPLGEAQTIAMPAAAHAGLAVTAHNNSALNTSVFEHVSANP